MLYMQCFNTSDQGEPRGSHHDVPDIAPAHHGVAMMLPGNMVYVASPLGNLGVHTGQNARVRVTTIKCNNMGQG